MHSTISLNIRAAFVAETQSLPGPTGETNELYAQGRGVSVLLADSKQENTRKAVSAMLAALLAAGNSVIVCTDDSAVTDLISTLSQSAILPQGVLQFIAKESYSELLQQDIRNFAFIGEKQTTHELNKMLATRPYTITTLVAETDLQSLPYSRDPMLVLRFITERVRTINITAIGGNAMLLELGNDSH